jgi:HEAT repeat protein
MKKIALRLLVASAFALALPVLAGTMTEQEILAGLDSPKDKVVVDALAHFEDDHRDSAPAMTKVKALLADSRPLVREKAARVLGAIHADVSADDLKNIAAMLSNPEKREVMQALKALRGLKAESTVPQIIPLLQNPDENIKRDSCRTLAVIGSKDNIKDIEPLTKDSNKAVVEDAQKAIAALGMK